jgi:hypothetical protein
MAQAGGVSDRFERSTGVRGVAAVRRAAGANLGNVELLVGSTPIGSNPEVRNSQQLRINSSPVFSAGTGIAAAGAARI